MDPITIAMLATTAMSAMQNKKNADQAKKEKVAAIRYSPWSKIGIPEAPPANMWGDLAQGGAGALGYEQNKEAMLLNKQLKEAQIKALNRNPAAIESPMINSGSRGYSPWMGALNSQYGTPYGY